MERPALEIMGGRGIGVRREKPLRGRGRGEVLERDQGDFVDAVAVEVDHLDQIPGVVERLALARHMAEALYDEAGKGLVIAFVGGVEREIGHGALEVPGVEHAVHEPRAVVAADSFRLVAIALGGHLTDDRFHDVVQGDEAGDPAEFVGDEGDVFAGFLEGFEQGRGGLGW